MTEDDESKALKHAYRLLGYRDRSVSEMRERLKNKEFSGSVIEHVLSQLTKDGLLDDEEMARRYVEWSKDRKPMGRRRLRLELEKKGIDRQIIDNVLNEMMNRNLEEQLAERAVSQRGGVPSKSLPDKERQKKLRRVFSHLLRRGFSRPVARRILFED